MFNICGSYAQIVFGNVSNHFSLLGNYWLSQEAKMVVFEVKTPLSGGVPEEGLIGPKVVKHAW